MSAELPSQEPKPIPRKRRTAPKPPTQSPLGEDGWFKEPKIHAEVIRRITCGCSNCTSIFSIPDYSGNLTKVLGKYEDINLKVHHSNRESGWKTPSQEAEQILFEHNKNDSV